MSHRKWNKRPNGQHWPLWPVRPVIPQPMRHSASPPGSVSTSLYHLFGFSSYTGWLHYYSKLLLSQTRVSIVWRVSTFKVKQTDNLSKLYEINESRLSCDDWIKSSSCSARQRRRTFVALWIGGSAGSSFEPPSPDSPFAGAAPRGSGL